VPLRKLFSFYLIGLFLNNFLPGAVGGDVAKAYYLYQRTGQGHYAISSVFLERFSGLLGLSILSVVALAVGFPRVNQPLLLTSVGGSALFLMLVVLVLWWAPLLPSIQRGMGMVLPRRIGTQLQQLYGALASYRQHRSVLLQAVALSVVLQVLYAFYYGGVAWGLGISLNVFYFLLFLPLVSLVTLVPITLGGLGLREGMLVVLFGAVDLAAADILAVSLTVHVLNALLSASGGFLLLLQRSEPNTSQASTGE